MNKTTKESRPESEGSYIKASPYIEDWVSRILHPYNYSKGTNRRHFE